MVLAATIPRHAAPWRKHLRRPTSMLTHVHSSDAAPHLPVPQLVLLAQLVLVRHLLLHLLVRQPVARPRLRVEVSGSSGARSHLLGAMHWHWSDVSSKGAGNCHPPSLPAGRLTPSQGGHHIQLALRLHHHARTLSTGPCPRMCPPGFRPAPSTAPWGSAGPRR